MTNTPNYADLEDGIVESSDDAENYLEAEDDIVGNIQGQVDDVLSSEELEDEIENSRA